MGRNEMEELHPLHTSRSQSSLDSYHLATRSQHITDPNVPPGSDHMNAQWEAPQETNLTGERQRQHHHSQRRTDSSHTSPLRPPYDSRASNTTHQTWQPLLPLNFVHTGSGRPGPPPLSSPPQQDPSTHPSGPFRPSAPYLENNSLPRPSPDPFATCYRYQPPLDCLSTQQPSLDRGLYQDRLPSYQFTMTDTYPCLDRHQGCSESEKALSFEESSLQHGRYTEADLGIGSFISGVDSYLNAEGDSSRDPTDEGFYSSFGGNGSSHAQQHRTKQTSMDRPDSWLGLKSGRISPLRTLSDVPCEAYGPNSMRTEHDIAGVGNGQHGHSWGLATSNLYRHPDGPWFDSRHEVAARQSNFQPNSSYGDMEGMDPSLLNGFMVAESKHFARAAEGTASIRDTAQNRLSLGSNERDPSGDGCFRMDLGVSPQRGQDFGAPSGSGFVPQSNSHDVNLRNGSEISTSSLPDTATTDRIHPAPSAKTSGHRRDAHYAPPPLASCPLCEADPNCQPKPEFTGDDVKTQRNTIKKHNRVQHPDRPHEYHCRLLDTGGLRCQSNIKGAQNRRRHVDKLHPTVYDQLPPTDAGRRRPNAEANAKLDEFFEMVFI